MYKPATIQEIEEAERIVKEEQNNLEKYKLREVEELKKCNSYSSSQITSNPSICGGMPINGLESGTPIQGKALTLGDKIEEIAKHVDSLNSIVKEINQRLFRQEPNDCGISPSNPNCIDEYLHLVSDGIDEANTMLTNIVNKL